MGYKTGYEMRAAAPPPGSLTLPPPVPLGQTVGIYHRSGRSAGGCIRHGVSQTDHIGGAGDGVN